MNTWGAKTRWASTFCVLALAAARSARADDAYYSLMLRDAIVAGFGSDMPSIPSSRIMHRDEAGVVLEGSGEAFLPPPPGPPQNPIQYAIDQRTQLAVRLPEPGKIKGWVWWPTEKGATPERRPFEIDALPQSDMKQIFVTRKQFYLSALVSRSVAGAAWFRHQLRELKLQQLGSPTTSNGPEANNAELDRTIGLNFAFLTGGRAISENLQLNRLLQPAGARNGSVELNSLTGITTTAIDWKPLLAGLKPELDPLARLLPADQHCVFFPSFKALAQVADRIAQHGTILLKLSQARSQDNQLLERYERQLGISLSGLEKIIEPAHIRSVVLTGSDPYFVRGTDLALVFESDEPALLANLLMAQIEASAARTPGAQPISSRTDGLAYTGARSPDRDLSAYVVALPKAVLLTNSPYQVRRFAATASGKTAVVASLDEYLFFRNRYSRGDREESALIFLSDATIRRWCGPRWRILDSQQTRDAAVLAELQAANMNRLASEQFPAQPLASDLPFANRGELTLSPAGVRSSTVGTLQFMTPIAELDVTQVTKAEADSYERWRQGYQRNWTGKFDPIALRLGIADDQLSANLTVMPLIASSEYRSLFAISKGVGIAANDGDPHDTLLDAILAVNPKSSLIGFVSQLITDGAPTHPTDPLGWLGSRISVFADADPFWAELAQLPNEMEQRIFLHANRRRVPLGLSIEVTDGLKLIKFIDAARAYFEQTSPEALRWELLEYHDQSYAKITITSQGNFFSDMEFFYAPQSRFLLITPSEAMLHRALDRAAARRRPIDGKAAVAETATKRPQPWLGETLGCQIDYRTWALVSGIFGFQYQNRMCEQAWNNLPILNVWHRLYPDRDPVALHARVWHERLVCPAGGQYVWNDAWQTMESTVYGHPGAPKTGPALPPELLNFGLGNFGLTIEEQGLRARATLERPKEK